MVFLGDTRYAIDQCIDLSKLRRFYEKPPISWFSTEKSESDKKLNKIAGSILDAIFQTWRETTKRRKRQKNNTLINWSMLILMVRKLSSMPRFIQINYPCAVEYHRFHFVLHPEWTVRPGTEKGPSNTIFFYSPYCCYSCRILSYTSYPLSYMRCGETVTLHREWCMDAQSRCWPGWARYTFPQSACRCHPERF